MKKALLVVFPGALGAAVLSQAGVLAPASLIPPILFAVVLILALLNLMGEGDRKG